MACEPPAPSSIVFGVSGNSLEESLKKFRTDSHLDRSESWVICSSKFGQLSCWEQLESIPGIFVGGRCGAGRIQVAIYRSYIPWFDSVHLDLDTDYDPTKPAVKDIAIQGSNYARNRAECLFLEYAAIAISSRRRGLGLHYRKVAYGKGFGLPLEWAVLKQDFLNISLVRDDLKRDFLNSSFARDDLVSQALELCQSLSQDNPEVDGQIISLLRNVLEFYGGREDFHQHRLVKHRTRDARKYLRRLIESSAFRNLDSCTIAEWSQLLNGIPGRDWILPQQVLRELGDKEMMTRASIAHFYHEKPNLQTPNNDILVMFGHCSQAYDFVVPALKSWISSDDGSWLFDILIKEHQAVQTVPQLVLSLASLLGYARLAKPTSDSVVQPAGCYLECFNSLLCGESSVAELHAIQHMVISFLRVLRALGEVYLEEVKMLAELLETPEPWADLCVRCSKFWAERIHAKHHKEAYEVACSGSTMEGVSEE